MNTSLVGSYDLSSIALSARSSRHPFAPLQQRCASASRLPVYVRPSRTSDNQNSNHKRHKTITLRAISRNFSSENVGGVNSNSKSTPNVANVEEQPDLKGSPRSAVILCCAAAASLITLGATATSAEASTRRHLRQREERLREEAEGRGETDDDGITIKIPSPQQVQKSVSKAAQDAKKNIDAGIKDVKKAVGIEDKKGWRQTAFNTNQHQHVVGTAPSSFTVYGYQFSRNASNIFGWGFLFVAVFLVWRYVFGSPGGARTKGRVVYDRSLGGKQVVVEDDDAAETQTVRPSQPRKWRKSAPAPPPSGPSPLDDLKSKSERDLLKSTTIGTATDRGDSASQPLPQWWETLPPPYVPPSQADSRRKIPQSLFREMERLRLQGRDYTREDLLRLHQSCRDNGAIVISQSTMRDALYRSAVEIVLDAVEKGDSSFGVDNTPTRFICGLCDDIGVSHSKGSSLIFAGVAARMRGILLNAAALMRQGKEMEATLELARGVRILRVFTPEIRSAEFDMLAEGIKARVSLEERKKLMEYFTYAGVGESSHLTSLALEALGVDGTQ